MPSAVNETFRERVEREMEQTRQPVRPICLVCGASTIAFPFDLYRCCANPNHRGLVWLRPEGVGDVQRF